MTLRPFKRASLAKSNALPAGASGGAAGLAITTQQSKLLASLFQEIAPEERISVLYVGPALQETVDFFSRYRCRIHFQDVFSELPLDSKNANDAAPEQHLVDLLDLPAGTRFDLCLFWDLFNYLDAKAITALVGGLQPCLHDNTRAHGFAVHNTRAPRKDQVYAIQDVDTLAVRGRGSELPGYSPCTQGQLDKFLTCFRFDRTVLLPDGRLEWVARTGGGHLGKQR